MEYQSTLPAFWEICKQVKKLQLEPDMEQWTGSKLRKEYVTTVYRHPTYLTYMQGTPCEMPAGWITSWNQNNQEKYQQPHICRWYHSNGQKWRGTKEPLHESERVKWKSWLKTQHSKNKDQGIWSHHFMENRWENNGNSDRLYFLVLQNHCRWWLQAWN